MPPAGAEGLESGSLREGHDFQSGRAILHEERAGGRGHDRHVAAELLGSTLVDVLAAILDSARVEREGTHAERVAIEGLLPSGAKRACLLPKKRAVPELHTTVDGERRRDTVRGVDNRFERPLCVTLDGFPRRGSRRASPWFGVSPHQKASSFVEKDSGQKTRCAHLPDLVTLAR